MARETQSTPEGENRKLSRRTYLKLAGGAVAGAGAASAGSTRSAAQQSRVNIVDAGADNTGNRRIDSVFQRVAGPNVEVYFPPGTYLMDALRVSHNNLTLTGDDATLVATPRSSTSTFVDVSGSGWVVDGFTIDYTKTSEPPRGTVAGANWEFKNCRFKGVQRTTTRGGSAISPRVASGSSGLIENVDFTDGAARPGEAANRKAIWFGKGSSGYTVEGNITIRGCSFRHWAENTIYGHKAKGHVLIEDCTFEDTNVSGARVGGNSTIRNCVFKQTGPAPRQAWSGGLTQRGIWVTATDGRSVTIEDCDFVMSANTASSAIRVREAVPEISIRNCRIEQNVNNAAIDVLDSGSGVTVEGVSVTGSASAPAMRFNGRDGSSFSDVCIQQPGTGIELRNSSGCAITNSTINVGGQELVLSGSSLATRDFSRTGSCPLPSTDGSAQSDVLPHTISIDGTGASSMTTYQFEVDGSVEKSTDRGASIDSDDTLSGSSVEGNVANWIDSFRFDGEIIAFSIDGPATVYVDGKTVDPASLGSSLPNVLRIDGGTTTSRTYYDVTVSGDLEKTEAGGASINPEDSITDGTASGFVAGGVDAYRYSGEITDLDLDGSAVIYVNGERKALADLPIEPRLPNTVVIDGSNSSGTSTYRFEIDGEIEKSSDLGTVTREDSIDGTVVTGEVNGGIDGYRFSGDITSFMLAGSAEVTFEDNDD